MFSYLVLDGGILFPNGSPPLPLSIIFGVKARLFVESMPRYLPPRHTFFFPREKADQRLSPSSVVGVLCSRAYSTATTEPLTLELCFGRRHRRIRSEGLPAHPTLLPPATRRDFFAVTGAQMPWLVGVFFACKLLPRTVREKPIPAPAPAQERDRSFSLNPSKKPARAQKYHFPVLSQPPAPAPSGAASRIFQSNPSAATAVTVVTSQM